MSAVYAVRIDRADVGRRVTVRRTFADEPSRTADVVGHLLEWSPHNVLTIERRTGELVDVPASLMVAARVVAPELSAADLQRQTSRDWRPRIEQPIGTWTARFHDGINRRSSSALALDVPDDLGRTVDDVAAFYAHHQQRPLILAVEHSSVDHGLDALGCPVVLRNDVLVATTDDVGAPPDSSAPMTDDLTIEIGDVVPDRMVALQSAAADLEPALRTLIATGPNSRFGIARIGNDVVGSARTTTIDGWTGLTFVEVDPSARRRGIADRLIRALASEARDRGATRLWLQVERDNAAAHALYAGLGFTRHHGYVYRTTAAA